MKQEVIFDIVKIVESEKGHIMFYLKNMNTPMYITTSGEAKLENEMVVFKKSSDKEHLKRFLSVNYTQHRDLIMGFIL